MRYQDYIFRIYLGPTPFQSLSLLTTVNWGATQVWNEIKNNQLGKQPIKNKQDLKKRLYSALRSLQRQSERIRSFFQLPDTLYALMNVC